MLILGCSGLLSILESNYGIVWVQKLKTTQYKACERDTPQTPNLNKRKRDYYEKKNE